MQTIRMLGRSGSRAVRAGLAGLLALAGLTLIGTLPVAAQGLFSPVIRVNDRVITRYELEQRARFYQLLNAPGDLMDQARERLIEERLQLDAAAAMGITASEEAITDGLTEFAGRANLTPEQFLAAVQQAGVAPETVRDFVIAGVLWRDVVSQRFAPRVQITEDEIDRATALAAGRESVRVLISEIILPAQSPQQAAAARERALRIAEITTIPAFARAARQYSAAPTRGRGGRIDWLPLSNLPPAIATQILVLSPGEVTDPIPVPGGIALFQLRALEETGLPPENPVAIEFARFLIPGGRTEAALSEARRIDGRVDTCDDLYGIAKGLPEDRLLRDTLPPEEIPTEIGMELARLDPGETSTALTMTTVDGKQALVLMMLCGRTMALAEEISREQIANALRNQRIASYAAGYLAELRADAVITDLTQ